MGQTTLSLILHGPLGSQPLTALVDAGATFTRVPRPLAARLGLQETYETPVELGDGRVVTRPLTLAEVEMEGVRRPVLLALSGDGERPLVGYTTLELLGFKVNPLTNRLEKTPAIEP